MNKILYTSILSTILGVLCYSGTCMAAEPDTYKVMGFDGNVIEVTDPVMTKVVDNIIETDGQEIADLYLKAVETGDYSEFYTVTKDTTETDRRSAYMQIDGEDLTDSMATVAQTTESWVQTLVGPEYTVEETGKMIVEAGYAPTNDGAMDYFVDILLGNATRPEGAKPVYRWSEMDLYTERLEDFDYLQQGIVVEYEDVPLTTFQRELCAQYGYEIKSAKDVYSDNTDAVEETEEVTSESSNVSSVEASVAEASTEEIVTADDNSPSKQMLCFMGIIFLALVISSVIGWLIARKVKK